MMVMFWVCIKIILFRGIVLFLTKLTSLDNFSLCSVDIFTWSKILPMLIVQIYLVYHFVFVVDLKYFLLWPVLESYQIMHVTILDNSFVELFCLVHLQMMPPYVFRLYIQSKLPKRSPLLSSHLSYAVILFPPDEKSYIIAL